MSSIVWCGSGKRTPTKATDCFSCSQRWGFRAWENAHQKGMLSTDGSFIGICYFMMSDEKDTEVLDTALLLFERSLRKIFGGSFLDLGKWLNIQMPLKKKKKWGGKYYKTALWSSKKPGTFTHCHSRHNNRTPSPTDEKEQVLLYALEHIISLKYKCLFHFILTYVGLMRKGKGYSLTFGSLQQEA